MESSQPELSRVFAKGQTVIPKALRTKLSIREGDFISWKVIKEGLLVRRAQWHHGSKETFLRDEDWSKLDELVADQRAHKQLTAYEDLEKAKQHSRRLAHSK